MPQSANAGPTRDPSAESAALKTVFHDRARTSGRHFLGICLTAAGEEFHLHGVNLELFSLYEIRFEAQDNLTNEFDSQFE